MIRRISIDHAQEGMVLARMVMSNQGLVLCTDGTPLTADLIERLGELQVPGIWIRGEEKITDGEYLDLRAGIEKRFAAAGEGSTLLGKIKRVILKRLELLKESA